VLVSSPLVVMGRMSRSRPHASVRAARPEAAGGPYIDSTSGLADGGGEQGRCVPVRRVKTGYVRGYLRTARVALELRAGYLRSSPRNCVVSRDVKVWVLRCCMTLR